MRSFKKPCFVGYGNRDEIYRALELFSRGDSRLLSEERTESSCLATSQNAKLVLVPNRSLTVLSVDEIARDVSRVTGDVGRRSLILVERQESRVWEQGTKQQLRTLCEGIAKQFDVDFTLYFGTESH